MMNSLSLYPTLTLEMLNKCEYKPTKYRFYYLDHHNNKIYLEGIDYSDDTSEIIIEDSKGIWNPDDFSIGFERTYFFENFKPLFGKNGIARSHSVLQLALLWTSPDSKQRGVVKIGEICYEDDHKEFSIDYEFPKGQLRGAIELTTIISLDRIGATNKGEEHLATIQGCLLGNLDSIFIRVDGTGSVFPIYEINDANLPLWHVKCDWEDPTVDSFNECVQIYINKADKSYKFLDQTKKTFNEQLLIEVLSSALMIIVLNLKEQDYWECVSNNQGFERGSVVEAVNYFINSLEWDASSIEQLSLSIREFFSKRM